MIDVGSAIASLFWPLIFISVLISGSVVYLAKKIEFLAKQLNNRS